MPSNCNTTKQINKFKKNQLNLLCSYFCSVLDELDNETDGSEIWVMSKVWLVKEVLGLGSIIDCPNPDKDSFIGSLGFIMFAE